MQDVARNFIGITDLKKLIDILSSYKLNVFRFHFSDDEGWRLQIPGLEELTEIASRRGHTYDESECCILHIMGISIISQRHQVMAFILVMNLLTCFDMQLIGMCQ